MEGQRDRQTDRQTDKMEYFADRPTYQQTEK